MQASNYGKWTRLGIASSTATSVTGEVDMQNFEGVEFCGVAHSSADIAYTLATKIGASTTDTFVAISGGSHATSGNADFAVVDVFRPTERWVQAVFSTTAAARTALMARQYGPRKLQSGTTYDTLVVGSAT